MTAESGQKTQQTWFSEGLVLALLSVMSYAIAFTYEAGYFEHFDLPLSLIEINISVMIVAFFSLLVTLLLFYAVAEMFNPFWGKMPQPLRSRFFFYIYFLFPTITNLVIARGKPDGIRFIFYFLAVIMFFDFVVPAISRKDGKRYLERFAEPHKRDLAYESVMDKLAFKLGFSWFRLLALAVVLLYLSYSTGLGKARSQTDYFALEGRANSVILMIVENKLIWTTYNQKTNEIAPSFTVEILADGTKYVAKKVKIGPLSRPTPTEKQ